MKIAVSSSGTNLNSPIDPRFGRASYFVIIDSDTRQIANVIDNRTAQDAAHGAGINAATMVAGSGAQVVLTGRVGPKAFAVLQAGGVEVVSGADGTVENALDAFLSGRLQSASGPNGYAHSGQQMFQGSGAGGGRGQGGCGGGSGRGMGGKGQGRGGCGCKA